MLRKITVLLSAALVMGLTGAAKAYIWFEDFSSYSDTSFIGADPANPGPTGWFYAGPSEGTDSIETLPATVPPATLGVAPGGTTTAYLVIFGNSSALKDTNLGWISSGAMYQPDVIYEFSFDIAAANGGLEDVGVYWQSPPLGGNRYTTPGYYDWEHMSAILDTSDHPEYLGLPIQIQINIDGNQTGAENGDQCYITNVNLTIIPEPTTVALLGFGSLALIRRKR
jgi:hypothetical protein